MNKELRTAVVAKIKEYVAGKDMSGTSPHDLYPVLYPDQVMPGAFEDCFREVMKSKDEPPTDELGSLLRERDSLKLRLAELEAEKLANQSRAAAEEGQKQAEEQNQDGSDGTSPSPSGEDKTA